MKNILLLERNLFFSTPLIRQLKSWGYQADAVSSSLALKDKLNKDTVAIILNLFSADENVPQIIKNLKENSETSLIPLISFSGHKDQSLMQKAIENGCDKVVTNFIITHQLSEILKEFNL